MVNEKNDHSIKWTNVRFFFLYETSNFTFVSSYERVKAKAFRCLLSSILGKMEIFFHKYLSALLIFERSAYKY